MKRILVSLVLFAAFSIAINAQSALKFDSTVYDFGQILISDGPVSCSFTATNVSSSPLVLQSVSTSCGCTSVKWDHNTIKPGQKAVISATYTNDEGAYPFDKTLTVKVAGEKRPVLLHIRGVSQNKLLSDKEMFPVVYGKAFAMTTDHFKCGNIEQRREKGDQATVANLSDKAVKISFASVSDGLSLEVAPNPIPAHSHATLYYTVKARTDKWGSNAYSATPVIDGETATRPLVVNAFTVENFSSLTKDQKAKGSRPVFAESTFSFNHVKQGAKVTAKFTCVNKGASDLLFHKADADFAGAKASALPSLAPGAEGSFTVSLDTQNLPKGEALVIITLTTNSPSRPIVNLFLAGWID